MERVRRMPEWITHYRRDWLPGDLVGGLIVTVMLIPQSMAYAMLAGAPPQYGLYASILPVIVYAFIGSSRYLAVGPVAIVSLMVANTVGTHTEPGSAAYGTAAILLAWEVGALLVLAGLLRFGVLANFLSHSVISGFINASALLIAVSQIEPLLGMQMPRTESFFPMLRELLRHQETINSVTAAIGIGAVAGLMLMRAPLARLLRLLKVPEAVISVATRTGALVVVFAGALVVWLGDLDMEQGVRVVGVVPAGLPALAVPAPDPQLALKLLPGAALIAFVAYLESISVARSLASKRRQRVLPNRELVALGAANLAAGLSGAFAVAGGVGRSGVNFAAGSNTQLAGIITALSMGLCVLIFGPLFHHVPRAVLAAIVMIAVLSLMDVRPLLESWRYNVADGASTLVTFLAVLLVNVEAGVLTGLVFSVALFLWRTLHPHIAIVGRVGDTQHYRNVLRFKVHTCPHVLAMRIDESLYFANAHALEETALRIATERQELKHVVLICSAINFIDYSALETLVTTIDRLRDAGVTLHLAEVKGPVMDRLGKTDLLKHLGDGRVFLSTHEAMVALECL
ncbi:MAG: sulfate permease [Gammaproteobacteria bacterium]|nr:sulfate permease [Gammaproteobacteria bacterium]